MQYIPAEQLVEIIRDLSDKFKYFHLSKCICGTPMWKYPCEICGFYPSYRVDAKHKEKYGCVQRERLKDTCTKEKFVRAVYGAGNFLEFYLNSFKEPNKDEFDRIRDLTKELRWTVPDEIWDYYRRSDIDHTGCKKK